MSKNTRNHTGTNRKATILGILVIVFFLLEHFLLGGIKMTEGVKIGLYNAFIILAIVKFGPKYGFILFFVKLMTGIVGTSAALLYPLCGGIISIAAMSAINSIFKEKIGYLGIGITGAAAYNITVYIAAAVSLSSAAILYNLPAALLLSVAFGSMTGAIAYFANKAMDARRTNGGKNEEI